jgi:uncharacterized LabA/DUF88 family protein
MDRVTKRVSFIVDGFNLYYSLREMEGLTKKPCKWLDLHKLCESFPQPIGSRLGCRAELGEIHYFSAWVTHRTVHDKGVMDRHRTYVSALESTGVAVTMSQFKYKDVRCPHCRAAFKRPEEKETDVAMAVQLIELFATGEASVAVLMTGDSDMKPAIRGARRLFPENTIGIITPFLRHTTEMQSFGDFHFKVSQPLVQAAQFPRLLKLADGSILTKPASW